MQRDPVRDDLGCAFLFARSIAQHLRTAEVARFVNELPQSWSETFLIGTVLLPFTDDGQLRVERLVAGDPAKRVERLGANLCVAITIERRLAEWFNGDGAERGRGYERRRLVNPGVDAQCGWVDAIKLQAGNNLRLVADIKLIESGLDRRADARRSLPLNRLKVGSPVVRPGGPPAFAVPPFVDVVQSA